MTTYFGIPIKPCVPKKFYTIHGSCLLILVDISDFNWYFVHFFWSHFIVRVVNGMIMLCPWLLCLAFISKMISNVYLYRWRIEVSYRTTYLMQEEKAILKYIISYFSWYCTYIPFTWLLMASLFSSARSKTDKRYLSWPFTWLYSCTGMCSIYFLFLQ